MNTNYLKINVNNYFHIFEHEIFIFLCYTYIFETIVALYLTGCFRTIENNPVLKICVDAHFSATNKIPCYSRGDRVSLHLMQHFEMISSQQEQKMR